MLTAQLDDALADILAQEAEPVEMVARELIVCHLYRRRTISSGKAAELLGMPRIDFIKYASSLGIPYFDITPDELDAEVAMIKQRMGDSVR